jgi:hypothetical protein
MADGFPGRAPEEPIGHPFIGHNREPLNENETQAPRFSSFYPYK